MVIIFFALYYIHISELINVGQAQNLYHNLRQKKDVFNSHQTNWLSINNM